jgi:putative component of membrane protein insertase Oxa1/YidC/SpoIIIJ protein YidD
MKYLILIVIRAYWILIPSHRRKTCLFAESCSSYVYRIADKNGFIGGIKAFSNRYKLCRPGYRVQYSTEKNDIEMVLVDGKIVESKEMSVHLKADYKDIFHQFKP